MKKQWFWSDAKVVTLDAAYDLIDVRDIPMHDRAVTVVQGTLGCYLDGEGVTLRECAYWVGEDTLAEADHEAQALLHESVKQGILTALLDARRRASSIVVSCNGAKYRLET